MKRLATLSLVLLALVGACKDDPTGPEPKPAPETPQTFNVNAESSCSNAVQRTTRVAAVTEHAIVVADESNPAGGFTDTEYEEFGLAFDNLIHPVLTRNFGEPSDIDENGRVIILFTRAVNELTEAGSDSYVGGFFYGRDLFPKTKTARLEGCAASNEAEMFYMLVPDPNGEVNGNARSKEFVQRVTTGVLGHEFQHLINASRRLFVNNASAFEETWMDEGLSHIAEGLLFYEASGLSSRENIDIDDLRSSRRAVDAFNDHGLSNFGRLVRYLEHPDTATALGNDDNLLNRGAAWAFLRYAADRKGGSERDLWFGLVNSGSAGYTNLSAALGEDPLGWIRDWSVSVYADDAEMGVEPRFTQPSWNFRSIISALQNESETRLYSVYPLKTHSLAEGPVELSLKGGGAAFVRLGVASGSRAEIRSTSGGVALPGSCPADGPTVNLEVGQSYTAKADTAGAICVEGGATGAEFVYVPFSASAADDAVLALEVTGTGVVPVVGPPNPSRVPAPSMSLNPTGGIAAPEPDRAFEQRLRERTRRELAPRAGFGTAVRPALFSSSATPAEQLSVVIMRTR
jgi:hypothetical protein